jgi:glutamate racemase
MSSHEKQHLPIGVFDSGVGGLTVLRVLQKYLPNESFVYLGDTARLPYGTKSEQTVIHYSLGATEILRNFGIKLLVVACSTASSIALIALRETLKPLPVIGVLEPGARAACELSRNGKIVVIATETTVHAGGYQRLIQQIRPDATVIAKGCSLFVPLAEEGWVEGPIAEAIATAYLQQLFSVESESLPDCLVLGCTHFPLLEKTIKKVIGDQITIVDSAVATAKIVKDTLEEQSLLNGKIVPSMTRFLVTDSPQRFVNTAIQFLGRPVSIDEVELVDYNFKL